MLCTGAENIEQNIRQYLDMAAQMVIPRQFGNESIKFRTLVQRRQSMMYWVQKKCNGVETKDMWNASQEALHAAFRLHNVATDPVPKTYLTKYDLVKLIEHDMYNSIDSSVSQQQHLCWLLGFVCGVRPGTIGTARNHPDQFLTWVSESRQSYRYEMCERLVSPRHLMSCNVDTDGTVPLSLPITRESIVAAEAAFANFTLRCPHIGSPAYRSFPIWCLLARKSSEHS